MRVSEIERENAASNASRNDSQSTQPVYRGFVDVDFLGLPPFVMFTNGDCSVCSEIRATGTFEFGSLSQWTRLTNDATGVADVGSYSGIFALSAAAARPDLTVHAFEPNLYSCARLRVNKVTNKLFNVTEYNCGLGDAPGTAQLNWRQKQGSSLPSNATFASIRNVADEHLETAEVKIRTLDEFDSINSLGARPLIKIDVEHVELSVFKGMTQVISRKPTIILETFDEFACREIQRIIQPFGYKVYLIDELNSTLQRRQQLTPCDPNGRNRNQLLIPV